MPAKIHRYGWGVRARLSIGGRTHARVGGEQYQRLRSRGPLVQIDVTSQLREPPNWRRKHESIRRGCGCAGGRGVLGRGRGGFGHRYIERGGVGRGRGHGRGRRGGKQLVLGRCARPPLCLLGGGGALRAGTPLPHKAREDPHRVSAATQVCHRRLNSDHRGTRAPAQLARCRSYL